MDSFSELIQSEYVFENSIEFNENVIFQYNDLFILHLNIRSVTNNIELLEAYLHNFQTKPDIIYCSESWLMHLKGFIDIDGYNMYTNESTLNRADGVVVFVSNKLSHTHETEIIGKLKVSNVTLEANHKKLKVSGVYRCHDFPLAEFIVDVKTFLLNNKNCENHIILGDDNINIMEENTESSEFLNNLLEMQYLPYINTITRPNESGGTCIDHIFVKNNDLTLKAGKITYSITDHFPIFLVVSTLKKTENKIFNRIDYNKLIALSKNNNWNQIQLMQEPNEAMRLLISEINSLINISTKKVNKKIAPRKNWMTTCLVNSCNTKEKLYKLWRKNPDNHEAENRYKKYSNYLKSLLRKAKDNSDSRFLKNADAKGYWQFIKRKLNKTINNPSNKIDHININGIKYTAENNIAQYFNEFFCTVGSKMLGNIKEPSKTYELPKENRNINSMVLFGTNTMEVSRIIKKLKNKAAGYDGITAKTLKMLVDDISEPLTHVINLCFSQGIVPADLKIAVVIPIHKSGDKSNLNNYRPISLLSVFSKIFERILFNRIFRFLRKHNLISPKQFGFIKGLGTTDAISFLSNFLHLSLDQSRPTIVTFIDLSKAFDMVNRKILFEKLESLGIRGIVLKLIKSYFEERVQVVRIGKTYSAKKYMTLGVPQGSILGPLFFVVYINSLLSLINEISAYADDTIIFCSENTWTEAEAKTNSNLVKMNNWLYHNKLILNIQKTVYVTFGNRSDRLPQDLKINIDNVQIKKDTQAKYLGVIFDEQLKWKEQIQSIFKKTRYLVYVFAKLRNIIELPNLKSIYYALFHSIATYGINAWGEAYNNAISILYKLEHKICKIIQSKNSREIEKSIMTVRQTFMYRILIKQYSEMSSNFMSNRNVTRNKSLELPECKLEIGKKNYKYVAIKIFNKLPNDLKELDVNKKRCKNKIKQWIMKNVI